MSAATLLTIVGLALAASVAANIVLSARLVETAWDLAQQNRAFARVLARKQAENLELLEQACQQQQLLGEQSFWLDLQADELSDLLRHFT
jgi:hypothetical protein